MPWATFENRKYWYDSVKIRGRVVKVYRGSGAAAEAAAAEVDGRKRRRQARRDALAAAEQRHAEAVAPLLDVIELSDLLTHAALLAQGYHRRNNGPWRKRRRERSEDDEGLPHRAPRTVGARRRR
jgi:hypothetical protein